MKWIQNHLTVCDMRGVRKFLGFFLSWKSFKFSLFLFWCFSGFFHSGFLFIYLYLDPPFHPPPPLYMATLCLSLTLLISYLDPPFHPPPPLYMATLCLSLTLLISVTFIYQPLVTLSFWGSSYSVTIRKLSMGIWSKFCFQCQPATD